MRVEIFALSAVLFAAQAAQAAQAAGESPIRAAAARSVKLLQSSMGQWKQDCNSCHHQSLPLMALDSARRHGIPVDEPAAQRAAEQTFSYLSSIDLAVQYSDLADPALVDGYQLTAAGASNIAPSLTTSLYARRLARLQTADGHWRIFDARPPHSAGVFTPTALAARAIALYAPGEAIVLERARQWLTRAQPASAEDHAFRLLGLAWTSASESVRRQAARQALALQRPDGGWGQLPALDSDAYSTAELVYALRLATGDLNQPGLQYLLRTQNADGSWLVETRLHPVVPMSPPYFESGFPGGHNQFLSCAATAWAVMALAEALPATPAQPLAVRTAAVKGEQPWMHSLDDPHAATPEGTTPLMMAAHDPVKVKSLLARGADANARAKTGFDALMVASLYPGNSESVRILLQHGASPKPRKGVYRFMSAVFHASLAGDAEIVSLLIRHGADPRRQSLLLGGFLVRPLEIAAQFEHLDVLRALVKGGADVDSLDAERMTSLSWSALLHKDDALRTLLELGANPRHVDKHGYTPIRHTTGVRHSPPTAAELLKAALASPKPR